MNGQDKGLESLNTVPLVQRALDRLGPQVGRVVLNVNRNLARYREFGYAVVTDDQLAGEPYAGPLAGLAAGLAVCETDYLATVPCDAPFFPADLVKRLSDAAIAHRSAAAIAVTNERRQPLFAFMHVSVRDALTSFLSTGDRKADRWWTSMRALEVDFDDERDAFLNINSAAELLDAARYGTRL